MSKAAEFRERCRLYLAESDKEADPDKKQSFASQAFFMAQLAEKIERDEVGNDRRRGATRKQVLDSYNHNIAQFQMQIQQETDAAKRAALEELLVRENAKRKALGIG